MSFSNYTVPGMPLPPVCFNGVTKMRFSSELWYCISDHVGPRGPGNTWLVPPPHSTHIHPQAAFQHQLCSHVSLRTAILWDSFSPVFLSSKCQNYNPSLFLIWHEKDDSGLVLGRVRLFYWSWKNSAKLGYSFFSFTNSVDHLPNFRLEI